jgi:hypothetical protein
MIAQTVKTLCVAAAAGAAMFATVQPAEAFWPHRRVTTAYALPSVPVTVGYAPIAVARPVVAAPVIAAYAPAPVTTYYAPSPVVSAPVTTYYAPAAPVTTYYAPPAGVVGVPLGGRVDTFYAPAVAAPVTSYYAPVGVVARRPVIWVP